MTPRLIINDSDINGFDLHVILESYLSFFPFPIDKTQIDKFALYVNLLFKWNARYKFSNYTTINEIIENLLVPSLNLAIIIPTDGLILDLGSGPGIPGIPSIILNPNLQISILESSEKAIEFLKVCKSELSLNNLYIIQGRAEILAHDPDLRGSFNLVIARAFASLPILVEIASAFTRPSGEIIIQCSSETSSTLVKKNILFNRVKSHFNRLGAIQSGDDKIKPIFFTQFIQISKPSNEYPRSWKKMKKEPLWS